MGIRYFIEVTCPKCEHCDRDVYYAPTCGITEWKCPECGHTIDLIDSTSDSVVKELLTRLRLKN